MKKWIIILLSLIVVLTGIIIAYNLSSDDTVEEPLPDPTVILYNNAYYQIKPDSLISSDATGELITYLSTDKSNIYIATTEETPKALFKNPHSQTDLIFKSGNAYTKAVFTNFAVLSSECMDISKALSVFGVTSTKDIKSISQVKSDTSNEITGSVITDAETIAVFYNEILKLEKFSEDKYHETELANATKEEEYDKRIRNRRILLIKTASGAEFHIECYPHFKWVYSQTTQTYYKMNDIFADWAKTNLK
jgi:LPS O-antigen subunit length determinant protein (WzzB/FepE family)